MGRAVGQSFSGKNGVEFRYDNHEAWKDTEDEVPPLAMKTTGSRYPSMATSSLISPKLDTVVQVFQHGLQSPLEYAYL